MTLLAASAQTGLSGCSPSEEYGEESREEMLAEDEQVCRFLEGTASLFNLQIHNVVDYRHMMGLTDFKPLLCLYKSPTSCDSHNHITTTT